MSRSLISIYDQTKIQTHLLKNNNKKKKYRQIQETPLLLHPRCTSALSPGLHGYKAEKREFSREAK
jgi:hypothetical protein